MTYLRYWRAMIICAFTGGIGYYFWLLFLIVSVALGFHFYITQLDQGLIVTNLSDHVSWGAYIANFTFLVGVAAAAVLLVTPTYVFNYKDTKQVVLIGELMAVSAIVMCLLFIIVDLGRPDRFLHILPYFGRLNFPTSILAWDVVVLNGYLLLNLHIPGYLLYKRYLGEEPTLRYYLPLVFISIFWAISIHTVTAFLYTGLGGRPFWNTAILAPRFLVSAFAAGPALLSIVFLIIDRLTDLEVPPSVFQLLKRLFKIFLPINSFLLGCELFKEFYTNSVHVASAQYLFFGLDGAHMLVPYIWGSIAMTVTAMIIIFTPALAKIEELYILACLFAFVGIWVEKGMGLIVPGFIPSPSGAIVEYTPSLAETMISYGIWAFGALTFTLFAKVAIAILTGKLRAQRTGG